MAVGTALAIGAGVSALASGVGGAIKSGQGRKMARKAENNISQYERGPLENVARGMQVSRLGADLAAEEQARLGATSVDALRRSGTRGLIGGLGRVAQQSNLFNRQIGSELDRQQREIDMLEAQDEASIRSIKEERDRQNLAGLGQQLQAGRAMQQQGFQTMTGAIPFALSGISGAFGGGGGGASSSLKGLPSKQATQSLALRNIDPYAASSGYGGSYG